MRSWLRRSWRGRAWNFAGGYAECLASGCHWPRAWRASPGAGGCGTGSASACWCRRRAPRSPS